jgi:outer membrane protein assembly factor BamB
MTRAAVLSLLAASLARGASGQSPSWTQWGGPTRDFKVVGSGIAKDWSSDGPKTLWSRELGEGYSSIVSDGRVLVTMYRPVRGLLSAMVGKMMAASDPEAVIAIDAATGRTLWEFSYDAPVLPGMDVSRGRGPHSTPLIAGGLVYCVGTNGKLHALDLLSGRLVWAHDLWADLHGKIMGRGYSPSPLLFKDTLIVPLGGKDQALAAFSLKDGKLVWKGGDLVVAPASPTLIDLDGEDQIVLFHAAGVAGLDPYDGRILWRYPHTTDWGLNISTPVFGPDRRLFISSAYGSGSRVLELSRRAGGTAVKEVAFSGKLKVHFGTVVRIGDVVYGSSGDFGPALFTAFDVSKGEILWQDRSFARASFVATEDRFVVLDEDGQLLLVEVTPQGPKLHGRTSVLENLSWTAPTLVGKRLFVRDRHTLKALDLG